MEELDALLRGGGGDGPAILRHIRLNKVSAVLD